MEPVKKPVRFVVPLSKVPVMDVTQLIGSDKQRVKLALGGSTTMTFDITTLADVRVGDLCTLYTEFPMKGPN